MHVQLSYIGNSVLNPTTIILFPTKPTQDEFIHVASMTHVVPPFSQMPLLPWCPLPFATRSDGDGHGLASLMRFPYYICRDICQDLPKKGPRENILFSKYNPLNHVGRISKTDGPFMRYLPFHFHGPTLVTVMASVLRVFSAASPPHPPYISHLNLLCFLPPHPAVTVHLLPFERNHSNTALCVCCSPGCNKLL